MITAFDTSPLPLPKGMLGLRRLHQRLSCRVRGSSQGMLGLTRAWTCLPLTARLPTRIQTQTSQQTPVTHRATADPSIRDTGKGIISVPPVLTPIIVKIC